MRDPGLKIPKHVKDRLQFIRSFDTGGSAAKTFVVKDKHSSYFILKYADWDGIGDNGVPWLIAQTNRLVKLRKMLPPEAYEWLPEVYEYRRYDNAFYVLLEYFEDASPLSEYYLHHQGEFIDSYLSDIDKIASFFGKYLYPLGKLQIPDNYIKSVGLDRVSYRLGLFSDRNSETYERYVNDKGFSVGGFKHEKMSKFFSELFGQEFIYINGNRYKSALGVLSSISLEKNVSSFLTPKFMPKYTHGDANLRNFLKTKKGDLKIIDLRGAKRSSKTANVCMSYDMGKILHTVWVDIIRSNNFDMTAKESIDGFEFEFVINKSDINVRRLIKVRERMPGLLSGNESLSKYLEIEPHWYEKSLFAEACHILADTVNRLEQDHTGRHSLAYYLFGTMLLNDLINDINGMN